MEPTRDRSKVAFSSNSIIREIFIKAQSAEGIAVLEVQEPHPQPPPRKRGGDSRLVQQLDVETFYIGSNNFYIYKL
jgi:hypothetical protein